MIQWLLSKILWSPEPDGNFISRRTKELGLDQESLFITQAREASRKWAKKHKKAKAIRLVEGKKRRA